MDTGDERALFPARQLDLVDRVLRRWLTPEVVAAAFDLSRQQQHGVGDHGEREVAADLDRQLLHATVDVRCVDDHHRRRGRIRGGAAVLLHRPGLRPERCPVTRAQRRDQRLDRAREVQVGELLVRHRVEHPGRQEVEETT